MHKWEDVNNQGTQRMRVPGGWIYKYDRLGSNTCMVFVPYETFSQPIPYGSTPPATCVVNNVTH